MEAQSIVVLKNYLEQRALETNDLDLFDCLQQMTIDELKEELRRWIKGEEDASR